MSKTLILHVGMPKTASSAFQICLAENRGRLRAQNWTYPVDVLPMPKHQSLVGFLLGDAPNPLAHLVEQGQHTNLILSTEGLTNHLYDFDRELLKDFRSSLSEYQIRLFLVLRKTDQWLRSYYAQAVFNPRVEGVDFYATGLPLSEFAKIPRVQALMDQDQLCSDLRSAFGADHICIAEFESDWLLRFSQMFGVEVGHTSSTVNESAPRWTVELMRQLNALQVSEQRRDKFKAMIRKLTGTSQTVILNSSKLHETLVFDDEDVNIISKLNGLENDVFEINTENIRSLEAIVKRADSNHL